jgi:hypothetical protein
MGLLRYIPKPIATVNDWVGSWWNFDGPPFDLSVPPAVRLWITLQQGDTVQIGLDDSGLPGDPPPNPRELPLVVPPLNLQAVVDLSQFVQRHLEQGHIIMNTISLDSDVVTLTLMMPDPHQPSFSFTDLPRPPGFPPIAVQYHRKLRQSELFGMTINLFPSARG